MVAVVASELVSGSVTDIFHAVRRRCPEWAVTPHRVRKALAALQRSRKKSGKKAGPGSGARSSTDAASRAFPHDVVELRPHVAAKGRHAQWQWRGQVLRVAGYDDGETPEDEDQELPHGHCSVFWLSQRLEQWPSALTKESAIKVLDRPWVLGDRVARADDPRSLGTVVGVDCRLAFEASGASMAQPTSSAVTCARVPVQQVRAIGGFRAEDWVAHPAAKWVGKVEEAVFRVEVQLSFRLEPRATRGKGRHKPPVCVFQVSSEGLQGLEPAGGEDVTPQELSPHFPGQRVRAPARLWRQAEWVRGSLGRPSPRRGASICGVVTNVECCLLAVRWLAGLVKDSPPPDEWVSPDSVRVMPMPNSSEGWAIGDHVSAESPCPGEQSAAASVIVESRTVVDVRWADGTVEAGVNSLHLCPRPHVSAHDFLPHDFVARSPAGFDGSPAFPSIPQTALAAQMVAGTLPAGPTRSGSFNENSNLNSDEALYNHQIDAEDVPNGGATAEDEEILPAGDMDDWMPAHFFLETALGVVTGVNLQARTAVVQWIGGNGPSESEEVSVFELTEHPQVDVRLADSVLIPDAPAELWAGRVSALRSDGLALVERIDGTSGLHDVRKLVVVDEGESSEAGGVGGTEDGSAPSDGALSEISEGHEAGSEAAYAVEGEDAEEWGEPIEEPREESATEGSASGPSWWEAAPAPVPLGASGSAQDSTPADEEHPAEGEEPGAMEATPEILPFDVFDDVEPSDHYFLAQTTLGTRALMMAVRREMVVLRKGLLEGSEGCAASIVVRAFSARSDLFRAMVAGPPDTPYAHVPFFFDLAIPAGYPREPPLAHFHAHYAGAERLNPNLYVDGKVCLSLLGTWSGPAWDPQRSTLLQVLVSLQGLVLVEEPYYNEPGHECDVGTEQGRQNSALYSENARLLALRAALNVALSPPRGFEQIVASYFAKFGPILVRECEEALEEPRARTYSDGFRKVLAKTLLPRLRERWGSSCGSSS